LEKGVQEQELSESRFHARLSNVPVSRERALITWVFRIPFVKEGCMECIVIANRRRAEHFLSRGPPVLLLLSIMIMI